MNYLQDILAQAQQGQAIDNLARTYGISPEEAQQAVEATLPAFAVGLQRSAQTPQSFAELLGAMTRNPYGQAFEDPNTGLGADMRAQGNDALAAMFGSPDVSRAVAVQASSTSGLSPELLKQMLPAIAALVFGGMMKGGAGGGGGLGDLLGSILGGGAGGAGAGTQAPQPQAQRPSGSGNPLEDLLGSVLGGGAGGAGAGTQVPQPGQRPSGSGNPLEDLLGSILGGGAQQPRGGGLQQDAQVPSPGQARPGAGNDPLGDLLGGILGGVFGGGGQGRSGGTGGAGGGTAQDPRLQQFQDIFDQFTDRNPRR